MDDFSRAFAGIDQARAGAVAEQDRGIAIERRLFDTADIFSAAINSTGP